MKAYRFRSIQIPIPVPIPIPIPALRCITTRTMTTIPLKSSHHHHHHHHHHRRTLFTSALSCAGDARNKTQVYVSRSRSALVNLSVEDYLLRTTAAESTVLFLYVNGGPGVVVLGRNQNPWVEADMMMMMMKGKKKKGTDGTDGTEGTGIELVRRRSGGGTVFHDDGNVNYAVICPAAAAAAAAGRGFDRDKHAHMVVRALAALGRGGARVNERHDIVVAGAGAGAGAGDGDGDGDGDGAGTGTFKVSGSAYKLTRLRSLHHGTCLLRSPNLSAIPRLLRSPATPFIRARGVESVRSPVRNLDLGVQDFCVALVSEFEGLYGRADVRGEVVDEDAGVGGGVGGDGGVGDGIGGGGVSEQESATTVEAVRRGYVEMSSREWLYGQTPRFTFSTFAHEQDARVRPEVPFKEHLLFEAKQGIIQRFQLKAQSPAATHHDLSALVGTALYNVADWSVQLAEAGLSDRQAAEIGSWLNHVLGTEYTKP